MQNMKLDLCLWNVAIKNIWGIIQKNFNINSVWDDTRKLLKVILGLIIALCLCRRMFSFLGDARCIACEAYAAYSLFWNSSAREERREEREIKKVLKMSNLCDE